MSQAEAVQRAKDHFGRLLEQQIKIVEQMKAGMDWIDYFKVKPIVIGVVGGDGIGPNITQEAIRVLKYLLREEMAHGKVELR
ncbi:MAG: isocitrate/isopropylmalate dehydrogenase family protein, partial [Methanotrichaceae archaeon]|nr:isocitrate/isopropylmalate dehydrogenase family protein [Methanotrichaceae archaeon]